MEIGWFKVQNLVARPAYCLCRIHLEFADFCRQGAFSKVGLKRFREKQSLFSTLKETEARQVAGARCKQTVATDIENYIFKYSYLHYKLSVA